MVHERAGGTVGKEPIVRIGRHDHAVFYEHVPDCFVNGRGDDTFGRAVTGDLGADVIDRAFGWKREHEKFPGRDIEKRDPPVSPFLARGEGHEIRRSGGREHHRIDHSPGRDDADDSAFYKTFGGLRVFQLLADRNLVALCHEPGNVALARMVRHARERDLLVAVFRAGCEDKVELARDNDGIVFERLEKVPDVEKEDRIRVLRLDLPVLPHPRGEVFVVSCRCTGIRAGRPFHQHTVVRTGKLTVLIGRAIRPVFYKRAGTAK